MRLLYYFYMFIGFIIFGGSIYYLFNGINNMIMVIESIVGFYVSLKLIFYSLGKVEK
jgi:hypothetical protein